MMRSWITLTWTLTLSLHSLLSASAADRFPSLLLNTFFRNSLLLFHPLRTNSKTIVFSPAMGATLSMLPILNIIEDYNKPRLIDYKGYNHMHLNGFVDVISKAFLDVVIQPGQQPDEREALHSMLDHFTPDDPQKYIITADRGYKSYDLLFHCELKNLGYVFRVKSPSSPKSILSYYASEFPDDLEEFDVTIKRFFTDKATNIMKSQSDVYRYINPSKNTPHFYELLRKKHSHLYFLQFRVVKIKTAENTYEYLITNLPFSFTLDDIREC